MGVRASLSSPAPAVPGELADCDLTLENTGEDTEDVRVTLTGEPAAWGWITSATLSLAAGERGVARATSSSTWTPSPTSKPVRRVPHGFGTGMNWGRIILHELAHVINLGHVESRTSIMNEALTQQTLSSSAWGAGDLTGLRQLGREGGCLTVPPVPVQGALR